MKTLKKVLSVALVLAMALSLVTITSAAGVSKYQDFTDAADIANQEAVDLLTAIGVINGMPDGSYDPKGYVTRAQAAKIITYLLLGEKAAANLKASAAPFADVPVDHWAAPYIQFCVTRGIINGVGDNKFDPDGQVTAAQFAKMLLVAAGYGKLGEYVGADWAINTIVDAQNLKILDTNVDYMAPANRDEIARYAFNFYTKVSLVYYDSDKGIYDELYDNGDTLADRQNVMAADAQTPVNGLPSRIWKKDGKVLTGNYFPKEDGKVLATGVFDGVFFRVDGYTRPANPNKLKFAATIDVYKNGGFVKNTANPTEADNEMAPGAIFSIIDSDDDGEADTVSFIQKKAAKLTGDVTVSTAGLVTLPGTDLPSTDKKLIVGYEGLKKGDVVVYYKDEATDMVYVEKAALVTGVVSSVSGGYGSVGSVNIGGVAYSAYVPTYAAAGKSAASLFLDGSGNISSTYISKNVVAYVDSNRYIVYIELDDEAASDPYGIVLTYAENNYLNEVVGYTVRILKEDGTVAVYQQAPEASGKYVAKFTIPSGDYSADLFELVNYRITDDGKIRLFTKDGFDNFVLGSAYSKGGNAVALKENAGDTNSVTKYLSKNTKVFYASTDGAYSTNNKYAATTGFANTMALNAGEKVYTYTKTAGSTVLDVVVFIATPQITSKVQYAFANPHVFGISWGTVTIINGDPYKTATVFKDGNSMFSLTAPADRIGDTVASSGLGIFAYTLDSDGYVATLGFSGNGIRNFTYGNYPSVTYVDVAGDYFIFEETVEGSAVSESVLVDEDTVFYKFDLDTFAYTEAPIAASAGNVTYRVMGYVLNEDNIATQVYYYVEIGTQTP